MPESVPLWMTATEREEYSRRDKVEWADNQALIAAWLDAGFFDEEVRYLSSQYNIHPTKNSLANVTRRLQAVSYAEGLCAKALERTVESDSDWEKVVNFLYSFHLPAVQSIDEHRHLLLCGSSYYRR